MTLSLLVRMISATFSSNKQSKIQEYDNKNYYLYITVRIQAFFQGHEGYNPQSAGSKIFLHACDEDMKPKQKK